MGAQPPRVFVFLFHTFLLTERLFTTILEPGTGYILDKKVHKLRPQISTAVLIQKMLILALLKQFFVARNSQINAALE